MNFSQQILEWYGKNKRSLPWRNSKNPYKIWLSEIILQQTRVEQGLPYFKEFIAKFPKIELLAKASEDEVLKLWQGLGYYSRARNMHLTAKAIVEKFNGGPVGLDSLGVAISEDARTIEEVYEPYLIKEGFIQRTSRGRKALDKTFAYLDVDRQNDNDQVDLF